MKQYAVKAVTYYGKRVYSEPFNGLEQAEQKIAKVISVKAIKDVMIISICTAWEAKGML